MNATVQTSSTMPRNLLLILASMVVGLAAITHQSLWMDEGSGAFKALMPTLKEWWSMTLTLGGSDVQMPAYMFLLWCWAKVGALGEYALRCINLPWLILMVFALRRVRFWPLVCLTSPFVLYYVGELRPYTMQMACGAMAAAAFGKLIANRDQERFEGLHEAAAAALLLAFSSLTAAVWAAGVALGVLVLHPEWLRRGAFWLRLLPWAAGFILIGAYYIFTLIHGYGAASMEKASVLSVGFGLYELLGLLGLGPGRNELRASPMAVSTYLYLLVPATLCIGAAWFAGFRNWTKSTPFRGVAAVACAVVTPILVLTVVGFVMDFRVLGRHLSPAIPAVLLPIAGSFTLPMPTARRGVLLGGTAVLFMLASSIELRVLERHARDDYRKATEICIESLNQGKSVWWQADMNAARYYAYRSGGIPLVNAIQILESEPPSGLMFADVVIINRPDFRYRNKDYRTDLKRNLFKLSNLPRGFEVWNSKS